MDSKAFLDAVAGGDVDAVRAAFQADPTLANARTDEGATAVQWAIYNRAVAVAEALLDDGFPLDFATACTSGHLSEVPSGIDVNALSPDGFTPLALAVAFGHTEVARKLIAAGANVNARSTALGGVAPIHAAIFGRNRDGLRLLIENGADVNAPQQGGFTALHGAAQNDDLETVELLLAYGANQETITDEGKSALDFATSDGVRARLK